MGWIIAGGITAFFIIALYYLSNLNHQVSNAVNTKARGSGH